MIAAGGYVYPPAACYLSDKISITAAAMINGIKNSSLLDPSFIILSISFFIRVYHNTAKKTFEIISNYLIWH